MSKEVTKLKKKADTVFSKYIRMRDGVKTEHGWYAGCITCGAYKPVAQQQAGHFVSRACNKLRFDEENVNVQCFSCNVKQHGNQFEYAKQVDLKYGDGTADKLHNQRHDTKQFKAFELQEIIDEYSKQIKEMEG